jgi:ATP-dependent helicase/nuclease subunit A
MNTFTDSQRQAIRAGGNVLVSAGAGTGKTRTLVERCLRLIVEEGCSLENILMVTFTEAAAAEMRARLRDELEKRRDELQSGGGADFPLPSTGRGTEGEGWEPSAVAVAKASGLSEPPLTPASSEVVPRDFVRSPLRGEGEAHPAGDIEMVCGLHERLHWLEEQLALLDTAPISTLHSFCLRLVREHFYELHVDPQVTVLDESQTQPLIHDTFDALFDRCYRGELPFAASVRELVRSYGGGSDYKIRALVLKLHRYTQSLPPSRRWLDGEIASLQEGEPVKWRELLVEAFGEWRAEWLPELSNYAGSENVAACIHGLEACPLRPTFDEVASALEGIRVADSADWGGKKGRFREPIKRFFDGAAFLAPLTKSRDGRDPLAEDWMWCRGPMLALLELTREFTSRFTAAKRAQAGVDFADLEQLALALLLDDSGRPTRIAEDWQRKLSHVFVDEYQDINAAQDAIIGAVSHDVGRAGCPQPAAFSHGTRRAEDSAPCLGNRFLVGDVKQSIYRFRLADPTIFRNYEQRWRDGGGGQRIPLSDNFRSRERILDFINPLFAALMRSSIGGVSFDPDARLRFGARAERAALSAAANAAPRVELHVITKATADDIEPVEEDAEEIIVTNGSPAAKSAVEDLLAVEKEARLIALRLRELHENGHEIWDEPEKRMRSVDWKDMVVLLRSPGPRVESFAKEFSRAEVPLSAARAGFYSAIEIQDLLNLLKLLDNPLQDIPLIAVLRSPLVGLSLNELATVRLFGGDGSFFAAINRVHFKGSDADGIATTNVRAKLRTFLANYERWRQLVRQTSVSRCLETVLAETHYEALLLARPRGRERVANVRRLLELARQYDPYQRQGLYRFLRFVAEQEDAGLDRDAARVETENAVRLMSIHQSKGLEFPVVALGCLGAQFNFQDLREDILLNAELGLCPKIIAPESGQPYPSLPLWMAKRREQRELLGEEMRLLYVAMTRARDTLVLTALDNNRNGRRWASDRTAPLSDRELVSARNYFSWLKPWLATATTAADWKNEVKANVLCCAGSFIAKTSVLAVRHRELPRDQNCRLQTGSTLGHRRCWMWMRCASEWLGITRIVPPRLSRRRRTFPCCAAGSPKRMTKRGSSCVLPGGRHARATN